MQIQSLGWEDPLEEGTATHSSVLAWGIPMDRGVWWSTVHGIAKSWSFLYGPTLTSIQNYWKKKNIALIRCQQSNVSAF